MLLIADRHTFSAVEIALARQVSLCGSEVSPSMLQLLGYIRNHDQYPLTEKVNFFMTPTMDCVGRLEESEDMSSVFIAVSVRQGASDERYAQCVNGLLLHCKDTCSRFFVGFVCRGARQVIWEEALRKRGVPNFSRDDCICFKRVDTPGPYEKPSTHICISSLGSSDADVVAQNWPFSEIIGHAYVQNMISAYPTSCVRLDDCKTSRPVAWILMV